MLVVASMPFQNPVPDNKTRSKTASGFQSLVQAEKLLQVAFVLLLDTGARLSEVLRAKWEDFELDPEDHSGTWRIPSPKAAKPQAVPILPHVGAVIAATPRLEEKRAYLVPGRNALVPRTDL